MSPKNNKTQPSISRFFQKLPAKKQDQSSPLSTINYNSNTTLNSSNLNQDIVEILDDFKDDEQSVKDLDKENLEKIHKIFDFDKSYKPTTQTPEQLELHYQYKRKLNGNYLKALDSTNGLKTNSTFQQEEDEDYDDNDNDNDNNNNSNDDLVNKPVKKKLKKSKLTPLDQQVKDLKLKHFDKILAVQVGYKYKFYCQDAVIVHKILNIRLVPGKINIENETSKDLEYNKLAYCSIPEPRLHIHLQRLLDKGLKVGVVNQTETSAINSMENSNGLFERKITNVFTKATYLEYDHKGNEGIKDDKSLDSLMVIIENQINQVISKFDIISIRPLTGEIVYDTFEDNFLRNELETRLLHLEPIELLYFEKNFSLTTENVIKHLNLKNSSTNIRTTIFTQDKLKHFKLIFNDFINENLQNNNDGLVAFLVDQQDNFQIGCAILIEYLEEFGLNSSFQIREKYSTFPQANHMILNSNTIENLEIFNNNFNNEVYGSLIWLLDHTRTKFGFRMLKDWISKPLIDRERIDERLDAIEELKSNFNHFLESFTGLLKKCPDLVKILNRLHYGKTKRKELYIFISKFNEFHTVINKFGNEKLLENIKSDLLKELFQQLIRLLKELRISFYYSLINSQYALDDSIYKLEDHVLKYFNLENLRMMKEVDQGELYDIINRKAAIEEELKDELQDLRKLLKRPSLEYVEKSREPYLIEIRATLVRTIPKDWIKINSTKTVARFRTPNGSRLYKQLQYYQELYAKQCHSIFDQFASYLDSQYYLKFNEFAKHLSKFDCLLSLAAISSSNGYIRPTFVDSKVLDIKQSRNPIIETVMPPGAIYTPNDISMNEKNSCFIITGPNMGGKSSLVKQMALVVVMAQIGCFIPAEEATLGVFTSILIRMGSFDNLIKGESTLFIEMSQVLNIIDHLKSNNKGNSLVVLDEVGRGTSTVDGIAIAHSLVEYLLDDLDIASKSLVLFITHYPSICKLSQKHQNLKNFHMSYIEEKVRNTNWPKVTFLYKFVEGFAKNSYGLNVAKLASIDDQILEKAHEISKKREHQVEENRLIKNCNKLLRNLKKSGESLDDYEQLFNDIKDIDFD
ncbi:hypothetical protein WICMUC_005414 [Wickerhamomyces mucosus]|uniref:DNA mismatch repair protein MSH3 n=1 Tax=Wickerhamomyces mucosus TaxID=1378264 RepID=A0A9P8P829_9ASCO|nr:hypothetical protein WICMUC_005414 [Wickerhamomyces mucosus]